MANQEQLELIYQGVKIWNDWKKSNDTEEIDLSGANLSGANLSKANLCEANLEGADLSGANLYLAKLLGNRTKLYEANLTGANLSYANLSKAVLRGAILNHANLRNANLRKANLIIASLEGANLLGADLSGADLSGANLSRTQCVNTNFNNATIENANIYGISIWDIQKKGLIEKNLRITNLFDKTVITVDDIEVAQFIYLMLNNENIRNVLGTISGKGVLILGRFTPERKKILDAIRNKLREHDFVPMMFDFEKVNSKDFTETIKVLAGMSKFVIADITSPKSSPLELQATIPDYKIPFLPIIQTGEEPFSMFKDLGIYPWVLKTFKYSSEIDLMESFQKGIINRALEKANELLQIKTSAEGTLDSKDFK